MRTVSSNIVTWHDLAVLPMLKPHAVRDLRAGMMELAGWLADHPKQRGLLVLLGSRLSPQRLEEEIYQARKVLQGAIYARIQVLELPNQFSLPESLQDAGLSGAEAQGLDEALRRTFTKKSASRSPRSAYDLVFEHLLNAYLLKLGPMTTESIMSATGFSYPSVADALGKLGPTLSRHSDKRVELDHFPRQEWSRFLSVYERGEYCQKFTLPMELARSPDALLKRFWKSAPPEAAVSGVPAARFYCPRLDLVGESRLDACISGSQVSNALEIAQRIDPALEPAPFNTPNPAVVIWPVYRSETLFQHDTASDIQWADPVTCLLALHDARFEQQAKELIEFFELGRD